MNVFHRGEFSPSGLVYPQAVTHCREFVPVFGIVDTFCRCSQNIDALSIEFQSKIIRNLTSSRDDNAMWRFQFENIHYPFKGQFIEIESVTHIVICRNSLGIVVYHYTPIALFTYCVQRLDSTPIEFHRGTYTVSARSQYDNRFFVSEIFHIVGNTAISQIKVIGLSRILGCQRVDLFYNRNNPQ